MDLFKSCRFKGVAKIILYIAVLVVVTSPVEAQIRIGLKVENKTVLQYEEIRAFITIYNDSQQTIFINEEYGDFTVTASLLDSRDEPKAVIRKSPLCKNLRIKPGEREVVMVNINRWFDFSKLQRYKLSIDGGWRGVVFTSNAVDIDVVGGFEIKSLDKNIAGYVDKVRTYSLRYWKRGESEHLFLRIDENASHVNYGVYDLGKIIRVFDPILQVDAMDTVKVIQQIGRDCYKKTLFVSTPSIVSFVDQSYHLRSGAPYPNMNKVRAE